MIFLILLALGVLTAEFSVNCLDCRNEPADILYLLDHSGSVMSTGNFSDIVTFVKSFTNFFDIGNTGVKMSIFTMEGPSYGFYFNQIFDKTQLQSAILNLYHYGAGDYLSCEDALIRARDIVFKEANGARPNAHKITVLITDGGFYVGNSPELLKNEGVIIYVIGVGTSKNDETLHKMATSKDRIYPIDSIAMINKITGSLINSSCKELLKDPCDKNPCIHAHGCVRTGGISYMCHCIAGYTGKNCDIDINECEGVVCQNGGSCEDKINHFTCICVKFYAGRHCEIDLCQLKPADIVFVLDSSYSADMTAFQKQKQQVKEIVRKLPIGPANTQIGVVTFSKNSDIIMYLNQHDTLSEIYQAVDTIPFKNSSSFLNKGLENAYRVLNNNFNGGGRYSGQGRLKKLVIVLYDGLTSDPATDVQQADYFRNKNVEVLAVAMGTDFYHAHALNVVGRRENIFINHHGDDLYKRIVYELSYQECYDCKYAIGTDMIFLVDSSVDMKAEHLRSKIPGLLGKIVSSFPVGIGGARYSLIAYHAIPEIRFPLSQFSGNDTSAIKSLVSRLDRSTEKGNMTAGLLIAMEQFALHQYGQTNMRKKQLIIISAFTAELETMSRELLMEMKQNQTIEVIVFGMNCEKRREIVNDVASSVAHTFYFSDRFNDSIEPLIANMQITSCTRK